MEKDKKEIFLELLETDIWIHKTNIAMELAIEKEIRRSTKQTKNWYQQNIMTTWIFSMKKKHINFLNQDLETTKSK
jgi:hypothetical protein